MGRSRWSRSKRAEKKGKKRTALSTTVFYSCVCKMIMFTCIRERKVALFYEERFIKRCFQKEIFIDYCVLLNYHCVAMLLCPFNIGDEPP